MSQRPIARKLPAQLTTGVDVMQRALRTLMLTGEDHRIHFAGEIGCTNPDCSAPMGAHEVHVERGRLDPINHGPMTLIRITCADCHQDALVIELAEEGGISNEV